MNLIELLGGSPILLAAVIFVARVTDVSLATVRTILVVRGHRLFSFGIGFVETLVWLLAASQVLQNLSTWYLAIAYAAGFATGNVVGIWLEGKLAIGVELVRVISRDPNVEVAAKLRAAGFSVTELPGNDDGTDVEVLLVDAARRRVPGLIELVGTTDPSAVWTISDVKRLAATTILGPRPTSAIPRFAKRR